MQFRIVFLSLLVVLVFSSCHKQYLTGYYSQEEFTQACEWKTKVNEKYEPKSEWMDSIATINDSVNVRIFLGTYCPDSKKWVPRFFKLRPELPISLLEVVSIDTTKKDDRGWARKAGIKKVPTFIFYKDEQEIGRITEKPKMRLEKRIFRELKNL